jgi:tetratricopeptide (TPR) repeat protein
VPSDAAPDQDSTPEQYVQRAALLADLGRYDEAAGELAFAAAADPDNAETLTLLARVHLAGGQPLQAIVAADAAVAAAPALVSAQVTRGLVLADLDRRAEAAEVAEQVLRLDPASGYAQTSAAAILAEVRNGQTALDAAWRGAQLTPQEPTAHLVLGLVAARMELFDLAERAYAEALRLDPELTEVRDDVGIVRLEQRRYARALERLAAAAPQIAPAQPARAAKRPAVANPLAHDVWRALHFGAGYALVAPILAAWSGGSAGGARGLAVLLAAVGLLGLAIFAARMPTQVRAELPVLLREDRSLAVATGAVLAAPCLILLYAGVGSPWPLALAVAAGAVALLANLFGPQRR